MCRQTAPIDGARGGRPTEQGQRGGRRAGRTVTIVDPVIAPRRAQMLTQQLPRLRVDEPHVQVVPLHVDPLADPARRRAVEGGLDFDAAIEMHRAIAEAVVPKRLDGQRPQGGPFFGKHRGHLPLRRAMNARVGPVLVPAIQIGLGGLERLEAQALQRRPLRVADAGFDFPFPIGIADATRQRDDAVVREDVAIERIERRIVDVRREHALFEIIEHDRRPSCRRADERRARAARTRSARSSATSAAAPLSASAPA